MIPGSNALPAEPSSARISAELYNNNIVFIDYAEKSNYNSMQSSIKPADFEGLCSA